MADADITAAATAVRQYLSRRVRERALAEDLTQEAVARLVEARDRLDSAAAVPYALAVARNLVIAESRRADIGRRHQHRMLDLVAPPSPEEEAMRREERRAVTSALLSLPAEDRHAMVAHVVDGRSTAALAAESGGTAGGVAARLSRSRARMRVDYLLASRNVTLPSERCRPVLLALSAGDQRRQRSLATAHHMSDCDTCTDLAPPLVERRQRLLGLIPIPAIAPILARLRRLLRPRHVGQATAAALVVAATVAILAGRADSPTDRSDLALTRPPSAGAASTRSPRTAAGRRTSVPPRATPSSGTSGAPTIELDDRTLLSDVEAGTLRSAVGNRVVARDAHVESVPSDEGFWLGERPGRRVWVQLIAQGESAVHITPGARVTFIGVVASNAGRAVPDRWPDQRNGLAELDQEGAHVEVPADRVQIAPG